MPMTYVYDEATLDLLRLTIPTYGILVPIIQQSGTNEVIDGRHRLKICEELEAEGRRIMLPVHHVDTNNPEEIDQIVNSVRRPWQDAEQRRELVSKLREKGHSHQRIADAVGTAKSTVQNDLNPKSAGDQNRPPADSKPKATKGKDNKKYVPPATPEEIAKAWGMKDAGMSTPAIAQDLGRGETTVRKWLKKERPEAVQQGQPAPTLTPGATPVPSASEPTPTPSVPSAGSSIPKSKADDPVLEGWNGNFNELAEKIYKREKPSCKKRVAMIKQLAEFKLELEKTMKAASNNHREKAGRLLEVDVRIVEAVLEKEGRPGIEETLRGVMHEAERIQKHASELLRILQLDRGEL